MRIRLASLNLPTYFIMFSVDTCWTWQPDERKKVQFLFYLSLSSLLDNHFCLCLPSFSRLHSLNLHIANLFLNLGLVTAQAICIISILSQTIFHCPLQFGFCLQPLPPSLRFPLCASLLPLFLLFSPLSLIFLHGVSAAATECFFYSRDLELQSPLMPLPYCTSTLLWLPLMTFFVSPSPCFASSSPPLPLVWMEDLSCVAIKGGGEAVKAAASSYPPPQFSLTPWDVWSHFCVCVFERQHTLGHGWRMCMHMYGSGSIF